MQDQLNTGMFYCEIQVDNFEEAISFLEWFDHFGERVAEYIEEARRVKWPDIFERKPQKRVELWLTTEEIEQLRLHGYMINRIY